MSEFAEPATDEGSRVDFFIGGAYGGVDSAFETIPILTVGSQTTTTNVDITSGIAPYTTISEMLLALAT